MPASHTVVIVEDDSHITMLLRHSLEMVGFHAYEAATGQQGVELVREHNPDLVTVDLGLGDVDGIQVCRRIREFSDTFIMVISARAEEIDQLVAREMGADDFVAKPFSPHELQERVTALLDGRAGEGTQRSATRRGARSGEHAGSDLLDRMSRPPATYPRSGSR
jgi:two-component system, OmpR family, response regulator